MKKACIFTFHNVPNYGAVLQTYALSHYVEKELDYHVDVMNFQCKGNGSEFEPGEYIKSASRNRKKIATLYKKVMLSLYCEKDYRKKYLRYQEFKKSWLSETPYNKEYTYDAVILGSDQIWNPDITGGFQAEFFGQSELVKSKVKVAYAASCGDISIFTEVQKNEVAERIKSLDYVGVREKSLSEFLSERYIENICTLDPTFLLSSDEYDALVQSRPQKKNPYILVYELQKNDELENLAFKIAQEKRFEVRVLAGYISCSKKKQFEIRDAGPVEFLSLIKDADYILTNSFHGTAFSLIYKKDFNVILPRIRTSRVVDLLTELGLAGRIVGKGECETNYAHIDYSAIGKNIEKLKVSSKCFLQEALGGVAD